jgi:dTDP-L-rhamnose 4-epimerase
MKKDNIGSTCLVTGGAGFIGCAISDELVKKYERVIAMDNLHPQIHKTGERPAALNQAVELVKADVTNASAWDEFLSTRKPDLVVHLAAETGTGQSLTEGSRHALVNVVGTTQMLDAFARHKVIPQKIVLSSSRAIYGEGAWSSNTGEWHYPGQRSSTMLANGIWDFPGLTNHPFRADQTPPNPTSIYGATKLAQEHILASWTKSFGVSLNILRLQNVYGPGQSLTNPYTGIVSLFARIAKAGKSIPLYEDGAMQRDFVFISDVAAAILAAAQQRVSNVLVDIGTGSSISISELANIIAKIYSAPAPHVTGQYRNGDVRHAACTIESAREHLSWNPQISVEEGIHQLCVWIDEHAKELPEL